MIVDPCIKGSESENYSCGENNERKLIVLTLEAGVWRSIGMSCVYLQGLTSSFARFLFSRHLPFKT